MYVWYKGYLRRIQGGIRSIYTPYMYKGYLYSSCQGECRPCMVVAVCDIPQPLMSRPPLMPISPLPAHENYIESTAPENYNPLPPRSTIQCPKNQNPCMQKLQSTAPEKYNPMPQELESLHIKTTIHCPRELQSLPPKTTIHCIDLLREEIPFQLGKIFRKNKWG